MEGRIKALSQASRHVKCIQHLMKKLNILTSSLDVMGLEAMERHKEVKEEGRTCAELALIIPRYLPNELPMMVVMYYGNCSLTKDK